MASDLRTELDGLYCVLGLKEKTFSSSQDGQTYELHDNNDLTNDELSTLNSLRQTSYLRTIKNCVVFFTVISIISLILCFVGLVM